MTDYVSKDDLGTDLRVTITESGTAVDVSTTTAKQVELTKPDGTILTRTATFVTDGTDGVISYVIVAADRESNSKLMKGQWSYRGVVTFSATRKFYSIEPKTFEVV